MGNQNSNENFKSRVKDLFITKYPICNGEDDLLLLSQPSDRSLKVVVNGRESRPSVVFWFNQYPDGQKVYENLPDEAFYIIPDEMNDQPDEMNDQFIVLLSHIMGDEDLFIKTPAQLKVIYSTRFIFYFDVIDMDNFLQLKPIQFDNPQASNRKRVFFNFLHQGGGRLLIPGFKF